MRKFPIKVYGLMTALQSVVDCVKVRHRYWNGRVYAVSYMSLTNWVRLKLTGDSGVLT